MNNSENRLLVLYMFSRMTILVDEWSFYKVLMMMYSRKYPKLVIVMTFLFGLCAITTAYKNLEKIEQRMGATDNWFLWPIWKNESKDKDNKN